MSHKFKKIQVATALLLVTSIGSVYGDDYCNEDCFSCQPDCCIKGFVSADFLYWRAFESGLDVCIPYSDTEIVTSDGFAISEIEGKGKNPEFKWNPGFRLGAGFEFACDLEVRAYWTHLDSNEHGHFLRWNIHYDVVDAIIAYEYDLNSCFTLTPFLGLRGARITQSFHTEFTSASDDFDLSERHNKQKFRGMGPVFGLEAIFDIGCNFSLYANASVSWLYGKFDVKLYESDESEDTFESCEFRNHLDANIAATDAGIGIRWQTCVCNMQSYVQLGLEHHRYYDFNRIGNCYGDLSFDGVNIGAGVAF